MNRKELREVQAEVCYELQQLETKLETLKWSIQCLQSKFATLNESSKQCIHTQRQQRLSKSLARHASAAQKLLTLHYHNNTGGNLSPSLEKKRLEYLHIVNRNAYHSSVQRTQRSREKDALLILYRWNELSGLFHQKEECNILTKRLRWKSYGALRSSVYQCNVRRFCRIIIMDSSQYVFHELVRARLKQINKMSLRQLNTECKLLEDTRVKINFGLINDKISNFVLYGPNTMYLGAEFHEKWRTSMISFFDVMGAPNDVVHIVLVYLLQGKAQRDQIPQTWEHNSSNVQISGRLAHRNITTTP